MEEKEWKKEIGGNQREEGRGGNGREERERKVVEGREQRRWE